VCPCDDAVKALAANVLAGVASEPLAVTSMEDGLCAQEKPIAILEKRWGKPIGRARRGSARTRGRGRVAAQGT
jgi:hypothetical protein